LFLVVLLPCLLCSGLSYASFSLGPFDMVAGYLPGDFGRKTVEFEDDQYAVSIDVPRSWYAALAGDTWWEVWRDGLNEGMPLENQSDGWTDFESDLDVDSTQNGVAIVETNVFTLMSGGQPIVLIYGGYGGPGNATGSAIAPDSFRCEDVRAEFDSMPDLEPGDLGMFGEATRIQEPKIIERGDGLCGYRINTVFDNPSDNRFFENVDPPHQQRVVTFVVPENSAEAAVWMLSLPEAHLDTFSDDIDAMIESARVKEK